MDSKPVWYQNLTNEEKKRYDDWVAKDEYAQRLEAEAQRQKNEMKRQQEAVATEMFGELCADDEADDERECPECGHIMVIRKHKKITAAIKAQRCYHSKWFLCTNKYCEVETVFDDKYMITRDP